MIAPVDEKVDVLEHVSASRLQCWQQCRLKFMFRYVERIEKPKSPALHIGKTVHSVLQAWNLARWRKQKIDLEEFFEDHWLEEEEGIDWNGTSDSEMAAAWRLLEAYFKQTPIPADEIPLGVEVSVEKEFSGFPKLVGIIDLVRSDGTIVDFKTSAQTPQQEKIAHTLETQLSCYSLLYREATGAKEKGFELHHLVKLKTPKIVVTPLPPLSAQQEVRLLRIMESYVNGIEQKDYIPSPGMSCCSCEYFHECRRWR